VQPSGALVHGPRVGGHCGDQPVKARLRAYDPSRRALPSPRNAACSVKIMRV